MQNSSRNKGPYRPDQADKLAALEERRQRSGATIEQLAERAGMTARTLYRIRRTRLAFPRQINALSMALRSIERDARQAAALFTDEGAP